MFPLIEEYNLVVVIHIQAYTLKRYPAQLSLTAWMNIVGAAQSAAFTVIVTRKPADWTIGFDIDLWSTLYAVNDSFWISFIFSVRLVDRVSRPIISEVVFLQQGIVVSGLIIYIQLWCMEERGPVFVTMFNPLSTIIVALLAYFALDEKLYMGRYISNTHSEWDPYLYIAIWIFVLSLCSIIGSVVVIMGLYLLLWGKEADQRMQLLLKGKPEDTYSDEHCPRDGELNLGMKEEAWIKLCSVASTQLHCLSVQIILHWLVYSLLSQTPV